MPNVEELFKFQGTPIRNIEMARMKGKEVEFTARYMEDEGESTATVVIRGLPQDRAQRIFLKLVGAQPTAPAAAKAETAKKPAAKGAAPKPAAKAEPEAESIMGNIPTKLLAKIKKLGYVQEIVMLLAENGVIHDEDEALQVCRELKSAKASAVLARASNLEAVVKKACRSVEFQVEEEETEEEETEEEETEDDDGFRQLEDEED